MKRHNIKFVKLIPLYKKKYKIFNIINKMEEQIKISQSSNSENYDLVIGEQVCKIKIIYKKN